MPTIGLSSGCPPVEPKKPASPKVKMPPSEATSQYPSVAAASMVHVNEVSAERSPSVTLIVTDATWTVVGEPLMSPVVGSIARPAGRVPPASNVRASPSWSAATMWTPTDSPTEFCWAPGWSIVGAWFVVGAPCTVPVPESVKVLPSMGRKTQS